MALREDGTLIEKMPPINEICVTLAQRRPQQ
jgi:hypothetical protein